MYYTLKDMAQIAGLNERTVLNYMQGTRRAHAAPTTERRFWQFTEEDLTALREAKLHAEQERTRSLHAAHMQPTDTSALETRVAELERQVAALLARYDDNSAPTVYPTVYAPPKRVTATTARYSRTPARPSVPSWGMTLPTWATLHGVPKGTLKHWHDVGKLPMEHGAWLDGATRIDYVLTAEGRRIAHQLAHLPWPCERCMDEEEETNETPHTLEP